MRDLQEKVMLDLEAPLQDLPKREVTGERVFSKGEIGVIGQYHPEYSNINHKLEILTTEKRTITDKGGIATQTCRELTTNYESQRKRLEENLTDINENIDETQRKIDVMEGLGGHNPDKTMPNWRRNIKTYKFDLSCVLIMDLAAFFLTWKDLRYTFSLGEMMARIGIVVLIGILIVAQHYMYLKSNVKAVKVNYHITQALALISTVSVIAMSCLGASTPGVQTASHSLHDLSTNIVVEKKGITDLLMNFWMSHPGIIALFLSGVLVFVSRMFIPDECAKTQESVALTNSPIDGYHIALQQLQNNKAKMEAELQSLDQKYTADFESIRSRLEDLKADSESVASEISTTLEEKDILLTRIVDDIARFHNTLKPAYCQFNKIQNLTFPTTTKEDIEKYLVNLN